MKRVRIRDHRFVHPLHAPGKTDLSADVDFKRIRSVVVDYRARSADRLPSEEASPLPNRIVPSEVEMKSQTASSSAFAPHLICPPLAEQRFFLAAMGLEARVNALLRSAPDATAQRTIFDGATRLVEAPGMGTAYKVLAIAHPSLGRDIPGFERAET
eukprot:scaffold273605_cov37-Tisochrysis_lutea.AAC.1